ncbi:genetic suppressor element 1-like [Uloborus diversus]|uniref:genetic suppressor element 1-like n=1 Tax=Uloborus diversus TaxID=327109 RepID=UPI00240A20F4|nr:genetic suppressor element 1-like [Uloborus diversus]
MSLNDYFAANGAVYLRPVGLPDCFPLPGLPHGCKPPPPPLAMQQQHPCAPQKPRTMATVSPLHQGGPAPYEGGFGPPSSRTSSFAAALRKLAKQAGDPVVGEKELAPISPVSSPALNQGGSLTPKRSGAPMGFLGAQYPSSSPPVVTIAPSRPVATHTSESRKVMDLSSVPPANNTSGGMTNGHLPESLAVKMDAGKAPGRPQEKWEEKGPLSAQSAQPQVRPHATIAPLPRPDDSLTSSRGFQPYRGSEESRNTLPHHLPLFEHHPATSYPYGPTFLPPPHLTHPAYRFDDPLYLERYSLLRPPVMPYPQAGMMAPPPTAFYPNSRYAADLIAQSMSLNSANNSIINERIKQEEERRMREKELELDQSRNKEQERQREQQKEKEAREREHREKEKREREKSIKEKEDSATEHKKSFSNSSHSSTPKRSESLNARAPSGTSSTATLTSQSTPVSSSIPLNLVMHPSQELPKKETELWLPWQQPLNPYPKDNASQEMGSNSKHPAYRTQENHRHVNTKDHQVNEKVSLRFSPPIPNDKKHSNASSATSSETENRDHRPKPHNSEGKKYDSIHHHITELSNKESNAFDWRTHNPNEMQSKDIHPIEWGHEKVQRSSEVVHKEGNIHDWRPEKQHKNSDSSSKDSGAHEWRHEKLQKACTNNHRKSHESKKSKEAFHNHQRKAVNGAILKASPYQNEGMHARLLESEKSRLELNGHTQQKPQVYNNINERLIVPTYKTSFPPVLSKDMGPHKMYTDYYSAPVLKSNVDLTPVVSKLDVDAKRLQKNDLKFFEDEGKEELRLKNLLIITKGPPLKFDPNPQKLKFLQLLGLTTHFKRKKIEFNMYLKRRKILREESNISPWSSDVEEEEKLVLPLPSDSRNLDHLAEKLRSETTPEKLEFFLQLGLTPITLVKKEEKERIRRIVEEEKMKRHFRFLAKINRKASPRRLFVPKNEAAMKLDHLRKMKERNFIPNGLMSKKLMEDDQQLFEFNVSNASQSFTPKYEKVPYMITSEPSDSCGSSFNPPEMMNSDSSCTVLQRKSFNKYSFKRGHSLKNEWRFPDPVESKNNQIVTNTIHGTCLYPPATSVISIGTQVDAGILNSEKGTLASLKDSFNWPGLESVMEAFFRHQNEQSSEKIILTERCQLLRHTQEELKKEAESLSRRMSELLKRKREMDDERLNHQCAIDRLKQCLQFGR